MAVRNRLFHMPFGGPYHDTWSTTTTIVKENYYYNVAIGPYQNLDGYGFAVDRIIVEENIFQ